MRRIRMVRKRDGRLVPFDERKIADAIYKAALAVGGDDRFLAEELAEVVCVFLEKIPEITVPTIEQIQDMVEKVLIETGHARTAKAYILYREERRKVRRARDSREASRTPSTTEEVQVLDVEGERVEPWREQTLATAVEAGADVPPEIAKEVAAGVGERIRAAGVRRVSSRAIAALADAELFDRGINTDRPGLSGPPRERVRDLLRPRDGQSVANGADAAGRLLLRTYSLEEIHSDDVRAAHLAGRIHIHGLDRPAGLIGASLSPDAFKGHGPAGHVAAGHGVVHDGAGQGAAAAAAALGRSLARTARAVDGRFAADDVNVSLAPLVRGLEADRIREVAAVFLTSLEGRVEVNVDTEIPGLLSLAPALDGGGRPVGTCCGELAREARAVLHAILDLWEAGAATDVPRLAIHVGPRGLDDPTLMARACEAGLATRPVNFVRMGNGRAAIGSSVFRRSDAEAEEVPATACAFGKVTVHLPSAAQRVHGAGPTRFLAECGEAIDLAIRALRERRDFLRRVAATPGAPLERLSRAANGARFDLERAVGVLGVAGLNEAVESCLGRELHEEDEALKLGERVMAFCRLTVEEECDGTGPETVVTECWEPEVLSRLRRGDVRLTAGARLRHGAPVDIVTRIEREGRFHPVVGSATIAALFSVTESIPPSSAAALVRKTFENTPAEGLALGREAP